MIAPLDSPTVFDKSVLLQTLQQEQLAQYAHLFADSDIFITQQTLQQQLALIATIDSVVNLASYQQLVLKNAPISSQWLTPTRGVLLGYDFHLTATGAKLIEINTNAGGALLNALLLAEQRNEVEAAIWQMFMAEWQLMRGSQVLRSIAIVDEQPEQQYLFPEFLLFQRLFSKQGIHTVICQPSQLRYQNKQLCYQDQPIDLVYNRLTDFALQKDSVQQLRLAYQEQAVVLTPHPRAHALYANKQNLAVLTDPPLLRSLGVTEEAIAVLLSGIAQTTIVRSEDAEELWNKRKQLFFKPCSGYGSKAVYRGDKLTKRVFAEILVRDYVAQTLVPPPECTVKANKLKFDVRHYVYGAKVLLSCGRLYQGQTTNFRTEGGGFAKVTVI